MPERRNRLLLITGATGFLGRHLVERFSKRGDWRLRLQVHQKDPPDQWTGLDVVRGSLLDPNHFGEWTSDADFVIHTAADTDVKAALRNPERSLEANCLATMRLLDHFRDSGIQRFVYISSARIYGKTQYLPIDEQHPYFVEDPYGASKLAGGLYVDLYHRLYKIPTVNLVVFSVYGPGQEPHGNTGVAAIFCRKVVDREDIVIYGDGGLSRDLIHVRDVCRAVELSLESERAVGETFNVGAGCQIRIRDLAEKAIEIGKTLGFRGSKIRLADRLEGDVSNTANVSKIARELGFKAMISLEDGLREYMLWYAARKSNRLVVS